MRIVIGMTSRTFMHLACLASLLLCCSSESSGQSVAERLKAGVDNPDSAKSEVRGGSDSDPKENMEKLFEPVLSPGKGEFDKWYSPHLRDILAPVETNRKKQAQMRSEAGAATITLRFCDGLIPKFWCANGVGKRNTACTICQPPDAKVPGWGCPGQKWEDEHVYPQCCYKDTKIYESFIEDSNFKTCCVKDGEQNYSEELIACTHPAGDGWAGLFEYYYPTTALGWENDRTSTMLATKQEVQNCVGQVDSMMEEETAVDWVAKAIERNQKMAAGESPVGVSGSEVKDKVKEGIKDVRPEDKKLRFSDSLQGVGLTVRFNLAALDAKKRREIAEHFCMRPEQFDKLFVPGDDKLFKGTPADITSAEHIWSNYCPKGVYQMLDTALSAQGNPDGTQTNFQAGMAAWDKDPLYCQRLNSSNVNMGITKIKDVIEKSSGGGGGNAGNTCYQGSLNGSMVPVTLYRHAAVERRTAIADQALGFLIGSALWDSRGLQSNYKRFEPLAYRGSRPYRVFWGKKFDASGSNEVGMPCKGYQGEDYETVRTSDQLYISDFTHRSFTQERLINKGGGNVFNKYVQEWAKQDGNSKKSIAKKGLDKEGQNYATAFRKFATCPQGFTRWQETQNATLTGNLRKWCGEENFGSPKPH